MKLFVVVCCLCVPSVEMVDYSTIAGNFATLLQLYSTNSFGPDFIPIANYSNGMQVNASMKLYAISDYDEVAGAIELAASLELYWFDEIVQAINGSAYNFVYAISSDESVNSFLVPYTDIWTPNLILYSAVGTSVAIGSQWYRCRYNVRTGLVYWNPRMLIKSACSPDVTYYPYDRQECTISFVGWGHTTSELQIRALKNEWDLSSFEESGEWTIVGTESTTGEKDEQSFLQLKISIERKPLYFSFNIIFPVIILCLLNGMVFWLPVDSGERVGFSITCFLSFVVLLNTIMDFLPRTSAPMSYLCYYLVIMMMVSGLVTAIVMLEIRLYHRDQQKQPVPGWLSALTRCLELSCCRCKKCRRDIEQQDRPGSQTQICRGQSLKHGQTNMVQPVTGPLNTYDGRTNSPEREPKNEGGSKVDSSDDNNEDTTWKDVVKVLDKLLFLCFLGAEAFFSISFLVPLVNRT